MLRFLLIFLLSSASLCHSEEENFNFTIDISTKPIFVTLFQECFLDNASRVTIVLSDGSRWIIKNAAKEIVNEINKSWKAGDDIRIKKVPGKKEFSLKNIYNPNIYCAVLDYRGIKSSLYRVDKMDANGYALITNEGSEWVMGWLGAISTQHWALGDRLTINKSDFSREEDYLIINLKNGSSCWTSLIFWR